jgi:hypothetical protein
LYSTSLYSGGRSIVPIISCPHCGSSESYYFKNYGLTVQYVCSFGGGKVNEKVVDTPAIKTPVYGFCSRCQKRIKLSLLRGKK